MKQAFEKTVDEMITETIPDMPDHKFSVGFERKMKYLIKYGRPLVKKKITVKRLLVCIAAALTAAAVAAFSAGAVRNLFRQFIMKNFLSHTDVKAADVGDSPSAIEDIYMIDAPDGFEIVRQDVLYEWSPFLIYRYENQDKYIVFTQYLKSEYDVSVNTENRPLSYISVNEKDGYIIDIGDDIYYLSWDNGDYIFEVIGNFGKNSLIEIAETVKKAEK